MQVDEAPMRGCPASAATAADFVSVDDVKGERGGLLRQDTDGES